MYFQCDGALSQYARDNPLVCSKDCLEVLSRTMTTKMGYLDRGSNVMQLLGMIFQGILRTPLQ